MKLKKVISVLTASLAIGCISVSAMADTNKKITMPIEIDKSISGSTVNGYLAEISYDPNVLSPVIQEDSDVLGENAMLSTTLAEDI